MGMTEGTGPDTTLPNGSGGTSVDDTDASAVSPDPPEPGPESGTDEDGWEKFAPLPVREPGRIRRAVGAAGRVLGHERTLAVLGGAALAVLMTWPALRYPRYTLPQDLGDPSLVTWILAWPGHALLTDPGNLWHGNVFYPERWSLAFTDSLLGYAPFGMIGDGLSDAILRYNLVYVFAYALAFIGAYALVRQLGANPAAALVAGVAFAYAPWRLAQNGHLHILSTGGIALALAMLARGHGWSLRRGFRRKQVRPAWIVAGWLVAAWQVTLGFGIGLVFVYVLALIATIVASVWLARRIARRRRHPIGRIIGADLVGGSIFSAVTVLMALPYLAVVDRYGITRPMVEVEYYSPPLRGFFVAPEQSWLWGGLHADIRGSSVDGQDFVPAEMALLPGFVLIGLAVAGLLYSVWSVWARVWLAAGVAVTVGLGMGPRLWDGAIYEPLYEWLPGWDALRTPGRMVIWTTLLLGVLAAGAVAAFAPRAKDVALQRGFPRPGGWLKLAMLVPAALVLLEGHGNPAHPVAPRPPEALAEAEGPVLVLPSDYFTDLIVMMWTTDGFVPVVNGTSGFPPPTLAETRELTRSFPDPASVDYLRSLGVSTVVVLPDRVAGTPWEPALTASGDGLGITREDNQDSIVFDLNP